MTRILIIGGTGAIGSELVAQLTAAGTSHIRVLSRSPERARVPPGVEVMGGDLTDPESLNPPLDTIDTVFLVWTAPPAFAGPAIDRIARTARRIVFLSAPHKTAHPFFQQPNPMREMHAHIEERILRSGLEWTILRPGMLARNALGWWARQIRSGSPVRWPYLSVPTAPVHEHDIGAVGVRALCEDGHTGAEYVLTGPQELTQREQVSTIADVIGRDIPTEELSPAQARQELTAIMPLVVIDMLLNAWAAGNGRPAFVTDTIAAVTGAPALSFRNWVVDHAAEFRE